MFKSNLNKILVFSALALLLCVLSLFLYRSCSNSWDKPKGSPIARSYNSYLYSSDVDGIGKGLSTEDSISQLKAYANKWIMDQLVLGVAAKNISNKETKKIDRLVENYRNALIISMYEQQIVSEEMDTVVTAMQLAEYYEENKDQYISGQNWIRCHFIKVNRDLPESDDIRKWFKSGKNSDLEKLKQICAGREDILYVLEKEQWVKFEKITERMPGGNQTDQDYDINRIYDKTDEQYLYLLKVFEFKDKNEPVPLSQVQEEISRIILQQRRSSILQDIRKNVYEKGKKSNVFESYIK